MHHYYYGAFVVVEVDSLDSDSQRFLSLSHKSINEAEPILCWS